MLTDNFHTALRNVVFSKGSVELLVKECERNWEFLLDDLPKEMRSTFQRVIRSKQNGIDRRRLLCLVLAKYISIEEVEQKAIIDHKNEPIVLPEEVQILEESAWMDGGTITLKCKSIPEGKMVEIELTQHLLLEWRGPDSIPGALYINKRLVPLTSELEHQVSAILKRIESKSGLHTEIIKFIDEGDYYKVGSNLGRLN